METLNIKTAAIGDVYVPINGWQAFYVLTQDWDLYDSEGRGNFNMKLAPHPAFAAPSDPTISVKVTPGFQSMYNFVWRYASDQTWWTSTIRQFDFPCADPNPLFSKENP